MSETVPLFDIRLSPQRDAAAQARAAIEGVRGRLSHADFDDARLMVSEIVTNSVRHAGLAPEQQIRVVGRARGRRLRVEVVDSGHGFAPTAQPSGPGDEAGWGLFIVEELATDWGVSTDGETRVWFEVHLADPA